MPTYVYLDNYRGFSREFIPLRRVNFLVGENSTGKTSFLDLMEMFCFPRFWLVEPSFGVPGAPGRHFNDLVSAASKDKKYFTIGAIAVPGNAEESCAGMLVTYESLDGRPVPKRISVVGSDVVRTIDGRLWVSRRSEKYSFREVKCSYMCGNDSSLRLQDILAVHCREDGFLSGKVTADMERAPIFSRFGDFLFSGEYGDRTVNVPLMFQTTSFELAPIRIKPKKTYDSPQTEFSSEGDHTPYVIKKELSSRKRAEDFKSFIERLGRQSGLFDSISVKTYGKDPLAPFQINISLGKSLLRLDNESPRVSWRPFRLSQAAMA